VLVKPVALFSSDFEEKLEALRSGRRGERDGARDPARDPCSSARTCLLHVLRERLEKIIEDRKARIDAAKQMELPKRPR
jgi:hypothetical protein